MGSPLNGKKKMNIIVIVVLRYFISEVEKVVQKPSIQKAIIYSIDSACTTMIV
jgi:hypothetical protein